MLLLVVEVIDNLMLFYLIAFSAMQGSMFRRCCFINKPKVCVCVCVYYRGFISQVNSVTIQLQLSPYLSVFTLGFILILHIFLAFLCLRKLTDLLKRMRAFSYNSSIQREGWRYWTYNVLA